jgi:ABC-type sugar transport system ATPase subunit
MVYRRTYTLRLTKEEVKEIREGVDKVAKILNVEKYMQDILKK